MNICIFFNIIITLENCGFCKDINLFFEDLYFKYQNVIFLEVNAEDGDLADQRNIKYLPTFQFFRNDDLLYELVGANKNELVRVLNEYSQSQAILDDTVESKISADYNEMVSNDLVRTLVSFELFDDNNEYVSFDQLGIILLQFILLLSILKI